MGGTTVPGGPAGGAGMVPVGGAGKVAAGKVPAGGVAGALPGGDDCGVAPDDDVGDGAGNEDCRGERTVDGVEPGCCGGVAGSGPRTTRATASTVATTVAPARAGSHTGRCHHRLADAGPGGAAGRRSAMVTCPARAANASRNRRSVAVSGASCVIVVPPAGGAGPSAPGWRWT